MVRLGTQFSGLHRAAWPLLLLQNSMSSNERAPSQPALNHIAWDPHHFSTEAPLPPYWGNRSHKSPLCFNLVKRTAAKHELKLVRVVKGRFLLAFFPPSRTIKPCELFRGPPSLARASPLLLPRPTAFSAWWFFTGSFICQDRINIVDGTNIVNLLEEWSRLNSISADKSREIYSEAAPLCWRPRVVAGLLVEASEGRRACCRWDQSDPSLPLLFCHFSHFFPSES